MAREVKEYHVRKNELLDIALELFLLKGYNATSVEDIIKGAKIAKGTFYHYFKSKKELLDALVNRVVENGRAVYKSILESTEINSIEKILMAVRAIDQWKRTDKSLFMMKYLLKDVDNNIDLWYSLRVRAITELAPLFQEILEEAIRGGVIKPQENSFLGEIILQLIFDLKEAVASDMKKASNQVEAIENIKLRQAAYLSIIEGMLALSPMTLREMQIVDIGITGI